MQVGRRNKQAVAAGHNIDRSVQRRQIPTKKLLAERNLDRRLQRRQVDSYCEVASRT